MKKEITEFITERANSNEYRNFIIELAQKTININNTPDQPLAQIVESEHKCFSILENTIKDFAEDIILERNPIRFEIANHPYYTNPYYTADKTHPKGLPVEIVYKDRFNLFAIYRPERIDDKASPTILNAHIDTVAPFIPFKFENDTIFGRGACDDKGLVIMLIASLRLIKEAERKFGKLINQELVYQFVIEEETGGNGSLSASMDKRFKGYEVIVCEATELKPHPANRGAMWFKLVIDKSKLPSAEKFLPFILKSLAKEGQKLREETNLELFPKEFIQINFGTLNEFGKHPSAINDYVEFKIANIDKKTLSEKLEKGLKEYTEDYKDRIATNELKTHYEIKENSDLTLKIFGIGGHMSALLLRDNAMIKAGYILSALLSDTPQCSIKIAGKSEEQITITGGVGFSPAHKMTDLQDRLKKVVKNTIEEVGKDLNINTNTDCFTMTFDMLHNEAYQSPTDCPAMNAFKWVYDTRGLKWEKPIAFRASCDARIYANAGHNTVTFGPGALTYAHAPNEQITIKDLTKGIELITLTTIKLTGG